MLRRLSHIYLDIQKPSSLPNILKEFPISFGAQVEFNREFLQITDKEEEYYGYLKAYEVLLTSIATNKLEDLEGLIEFNFLKKIEKSLKELHSRGYKLNLSGDIDKTKIYEGSIMSFFGHILPFRNLKLESSQVSVIKKDITPLHRSIKCFFENPDLQLEEILNFDYENFGKLDLESKNKLLDGDFNKKIEQLHSNFTFHVLKAEDKEVIFETHFKLLVVNSKGEVVSGNDNNKPEMHSGIFEMFELIEHKSFFFKEKNKRQFEFYNKLMAGYLNNYVLIDFDMFMDGNMPIPQD